MFKRILFSGVVALGLGLFLAPGMVQAAVLTNAYVQLSDPRTSQTLVTHDFYYDSVTTDMGSIYLQYCAYPSESGSTCTPSGASGGTLSLYTKQGGSAFSQTMTGSWDAANTRFAYASAYDPESVGTGVMHWRFTGMTNPALASCVHATPSNYSTGTCYVRLSVYATTDWTGTPDTAIVSITVTQAVTVSARVDPVFTFKVEGVAGGVTQNGTALTAGVTTTVTTIPFGSLTANTAKFAAQRLTVTTNTTSGYTVSAKLTGNLTGTSYGKDIDAYKGNGANQTTPQSWTHPTGTVSGNDTGWIGVGTDDTGVTNQASNAFYSLNSTAFTVASTTYSATSRVSNIVYGIEVNAYQTADNYTSTLLYNALPTY